MGRLDKAARSNKDLGSYRVGCWPLHLLGRWVPIRRGVKYWPAPFEDSSPAPSNGNSTFQPSSGGTAIVGRLDVLEAGEAGVLLHAGIAPRALADLG